VTKLLTARPLRYAAALAMAVSVTACGGSGEPPSSTSSTPSAASSSSSTTSGPPSATTPARTPTTPPPAKDTPAGRTVAITVTGKKVSPAPRTVDLEVGETLTLVVTSDHDDEIHAHGFEVEGRLRAGQPSTITVTGTQPGLYEVETHEPPLRLLMIAVR
jgi:plastocyanin